MIDFTSYACRTKRAGKYSQFLKNLAIKSSSNTNNDCTRSQIGSVPAIFAVLKSQNLSYKVPVKLDDRAVRLDDEHKPVYYASV